jgi:(p)ppGpp synthase/HD superfamily hydrolase
MLAKMLAIVAVAHEGQFDKAGQPYFLHCLAVMALLGETDDYELQCIALGHDLFEDTSITPEYLRNEGFTERVIAGIASMTKIAGESYDKYKAKVKANWDSVRVKQKDLTHNSDIGRIKDIGEKDIIRTIQYRSFYSELKLIAPPAL